MSDEQRPKPTPASRDAIDDPLDALLVASLAERVLEDDILAEGEPEDALTEADRQVLASLGSPAELTARIIERVGERDHQVARSDAETIAPSESPDSESTLTQTAKSDQGVADMQYEQLNASYEQFERVEFVPLETCGRKEMELGRGGQGVVYRFYDDPAWPRALKIFSPRPYENVETYREDMKRMEDVASLVYRLHHDNLLQVERFTQRDGIFYMIMQEIIGCDLRLLLQPELLQRLRRGVDDHHWRHLNKVVFRAAESSSPHLTPGMAVNIVEKCLRALAALHARGIVHGDIKPANIMLDSCGSIKLVDLGSAFKLSARPRRHTWTPRYAPPEFLKEGKWTPQSDLASLGYVLIELLAGRSSLDHPAASIYSTRVFDNRQYAELLAAKHRLPGLLVELLPKDVQGSARLMTLCRRLIAPDPNDRFADADDAIDGPDGAYHFRTELVRGNLDIHYVSEITCWLEKVTEIIGL